MKKSAKNISLLILIIIGIIYILTLKFLDVQNQAVDKNDFELIEVNIGNTIKSAAKELKSKGLIKSKFAFIIKSQLNGTVGKIKPGEYYLSKDMDSKKIIELLSVGGYIEENDTKTCKIRIKEGYTIEDIAKILFDEKIILNKERFLKECNNKELASNLSIYNNLNEEDGKKYILEGYLFPDTYEFYYNSKPEDVIIKMCSRFDELYKPIEEEVKSAGLNMDIVIKLASIIEKEANKNDFSKVSAVLKNRMAKNMALQCDSTIRYIKNDQNTMRLSSKQYNLNSPYNSYKTKDLPPSAICNPSIEAIKAVIHPDEDFIKNKYLYFCSTENANKDLVFAKTYKEHLINVKKYAGSWKAYDDAVKNN